MMRAILAVFLVAVALFGFVYIGYGAGYRRGAFDERVKCLGSADE